MLRLIFYRNEDGIVKILSIRKSVSRDSIPFDYKGSESKIIKVEIIQANETLFFQEACANLFMDGVEYPFDLTVGNIYAIKVLHIYY